MKLKRTKVFDKSERMISVIVMYVAGSIIGLVAIGLTVDSIIIFKNTVAQYVAQGYPSAQVVQQLMINQLLPGIFQSIAVYGGIALILFGVGIINQKVSRCLSLVKTKVGVVEYANDEHVEDVEQINKGADQTQQP